MEVWTCESGLKKVHTGAHFEADGYTSPLESQLFRNVEAELCLLLRIVLAYDCSLKIL